MTENGESLYIASHQYSMGAPSQPRIAIAHASEFLDDLSRAHTIQAPSSHVYAVGEFVSADFFEKVTPDYFEQRFGRQTWNYDNRRTAQAVLPFLYLGPFSCLKDRDFLRREGITLLLAIRNRRSAMARLMSGDKAAAELGIEADSIDVEDNQELIAQFARAIRRINDHISLSATSQSGPSTRRKVLVYCETGNERSASVVIAYLMVMLMASISDAMGIVQNRRFCVCVEEPARQMLASFESILQAKRDVENANRSLPTCLADNTSMVTVSRKRSFVCRLETSSNGDHNMDLDGEHGMELSERQPSAPFRDR